MRPFTNREKIITTLIAGFVGLSLIIPEKLEIPLTDEHVIGYEVHARDNGISGHAWIGAETNPVHLRANYTQTEQSTSISVNTHRTEFDICTTRGSRLSFANGVASYEVQHSDPFGRPITSTVEGRYSPFSKER